MKRKILNCLAVLVIVGGFAAQGALARQVSQQNNRTVSPFDDCGDCHCTGRCIHIGDGCACI